MTDDELKAIHVHGEDDGGRFSYVDAYDGYRLLVEVRRLRGLISETKSKDICPWCGGENWYDTGGERSRSLQGQCFADCPAFTSNGEIR